MAFFIIWEFCGSNGHDCIELVLPQLTGGIATVYFYLSWDAWHGSKGQRTCWHCEVISPVSCSHPWGIWDLVLCLCLLPSRGWWFQLTSQWVLAIKQLACSQRRHCEFCAINALCHSVPFLCLWWLRMCWVSSVQGTFISSSTQRNWLLPGLLDQTGLLDWIGSVSSVLALGSSADPLTPLYRTLKC